MVSNSAACITAAKSYPFEVMSAPLWTPAENDMLARNSAIAIKPVDGTLQTVAFWPLNYPTILEQDVTVEAVAVGPNVSQFKKGDRVFRHAVGMVTKRDQDNAFQAHTILQTNMASKLADIISYKSATFPTEPAQRPTEQTLLIWGGLSGVGSNPIQLATAAGCEAIVTTSPKNFEYVKKLGTSQVFNYNAITIHNDFLNAFKGKTTGALDCIGCAAWEICMNVVHKTPGAKFVATTKRGVPEPPEGVKMMPVFATTTKDNAVGKAIYVDYLPKALLAGTFVLAPEPLIAGKGRESIQAAVDLLKKGVSAKKVVISL